MLHRFWWWWTFDPINLPSSRIIIHEEEDGLLLEKGTTTNNNNTIHTIVLYGQKIQYHRFWIDDDDDDEKECIHNACDSSSNWKDLDSAIILLDSQTLETFRHKGDEPADNILESCHREGRSFSVDDMLSTTTIGSNLSTIISPAHQASLQQFVREYSSIPEWVDVSSVHRGRQVFFSICTGRFVFVILSCIDSRSLYSQNRHCLITNARIFGTPIECQTNTRSIDRYRSILGSLTRRTYSYITRQPSGSFTV